MLALHVIPLVCHSHPDERELAVAVADCARPRLVAAEQALNIGCRNLRVQGVAIGHLLQHFTVVVVRTRVRDLIGAADGLATALAALKALNRLLDGELEQGPPSLLLLAAFLEKERGVLAEFVGLDRVDEIVASGLVVCALLEKVPRDGHLERFGRELEVHQDVVKVHILPRERVLRPWYDERRMRRVPLDQQLLELQDAGHHELHDQLDVDALLRVHHVVIALLERPEDAEVAQVQAAPVLNGLLQRRLRRGRRRLAFL
mmetsp:Transcript_4838/g.13805  ORF Transcript_4838/g.13805 Transcript_4838/m.13805 type:complete len:260 (-) Transcript_4838:159-938(-)